MGMNPEKGMFVKKTMFLNNNPETDKKSNFVIRRTAQS